MVKHKMLQQMLLGRYNYMEPCLLVNMGDVNTTILNDKKTDKPIFKREYVVLLEVEAVFGATLTQFTMEQRKWDGKNPLTSHSNSRRRKSTFMSKETDPAHFSITLFDNDLKFKGSDHIASVMPSANCKLFPFDATNRTIIG